MVDLKEALIGTRLRQKRMDLGRKQADLADAVGISASYLNLIEHNRRRIGGALLTRLADALEFEPGQLSEKSGARLISGLENLQGPDHASEFASRFPDWAEFLLAQSARISALEETVSSLDDRLSHDPVLTEKMHDVLSTVSAIRSTSSILVETPELDAEWRARFHANIDEESRRLADTSAAIVAHFDKLGQSERDFATPLEQVHRFFERHGFYLPALEREPTEDTIEHLLKLAKLQSDGAKHVRRALGDYSRVAQAMPLEAFVADAIHLGHDPGALAERYDVSLQEIFLRYAHLPSRPDLPEIGYVACDMAGGLIRRRPAPGFAMPRFGAACPLWPLFSALSQPGRPMQQVLATAEGATFQAYAVSYSDQAVQFDVPLLIKAVMLVLRRPEDANTSQVTQVGASCRVCAALACPARREGSILPGAG